MTTLTYVMRFVPLFILRWVHRFIIRRGLAANFDWKMRWWCRKYPQPSLAWHFWHWAVKPIDREGTRRFGECYYADPAWYGKEPLSRLR